MDQESSLNEEKNGTQGKCRHCKTSLVKKTMPVGWGNTPQIYCPNPLCPGKRIIKKSWCS